ncbi:serine hydrolase domain-containing protein [Spongisporangium articulatum]|uniref:Serine hydrolase domain-containing protein n=1 Tax=Spongisporangium articulatum TaxID=3362603 RepID=A0ABW8AJA9_9ACTN
MTALGQVTDWSGTWGVPNTAVAVVTDAGVVETVGDVRREFRLASVTKLLTAYAALVALEEGAIELDEPAGPPGATVRHLLAHAAGYGFESDAPVLAPPGTRRVYSNRGIEELVRHLERATEIPFGPYLHEAVLAPLGMAATELRGSPASHAHSTVEDLTRFAVELRAPTLIHADTLAEATSVQFAGLSGVLPGLGRFDPCDWGLGFERNFGRPRHWAGQRVSTSSFGHFGAAGTFLWVDPVQGVAAVCLSDLDFGEWARAAWPPLCDAVIEQFATPVPSARAGGDAGDATT